jgi:ubiquinone/menaquinone biosynthesis C-methylase UbiE
MSRQEYFNHLADFWDKRFQTEALATFLEQLVPTLGLLPGQKILDVGTGTGILIPFLLKAVGPTGQISAIDYSEKMIKICKSKYANLPNVTFKVQQVETLDFPSQTFDAVTCFGLFPHIENKEEALRQMNRVLKVNYSPLTRRASTLCPVDVFLDFGTSNNACSSNSVTL